MSNRHPVSVLAALVAALVAAPRLTEAGCTGEPPPGPPPPAFHVIDYPITNRPPGSWWEQLLDLEGGTAAQLDRRAGECNDVPETYAKMRISHAAFSANFDLEWETGPISHWLASIRRYYQVYLGRQPSCTELKYWADQYNVELHDGLLTLIACSAEAASKGRKPASYCAIFENGEAYGWIWLHEVLMHAWAAVELTSCPGDPGKRISVRSMHRNIPGQWPATADDLYGAIGRNVNIDDYHADHSRRLLTASAMTDYANMWISRGWIQYDPPTLTEAEKTTLCSKAGPWVASYYASQVEAEANAISSDFRAFVDGQPIPATPGADWTGYQALAFSGGAVFVNQDIGWECREPSTCWDTVRENLNY